MSLVSASLQKIFPTFIKAINLLSIQIQPQSPNLPWPNLQTSVQLDNTTGESADCAPARPAARGGGCTSKRLLIKLRQLDQIWCCYCTQHLRHTRSAACAGNQCTQRLYCHIRVRNKVFFHNQLTTRRTAPEAHIVLSSLV